MGLFQPIKQSIDYQKSFSNEMNKLIEYINSDMLEIYKVSEISPELFVLTAIEKNDWMLFKVVGSFANSLTISTIHDKLHEIVDSSAIIPPRPGRKIETSGALKNYFLQSVKECNSMNHPVVTSDHVLLAILKDENKKNEIREIFADAGITYDILRNLSEKIHTVTKTIVENEPEDVIPDVSNDFAKMITSLLGSPDSNNIQVRVVGAPEGMTSDQLSNIVSEMMGGKNTSALKDNNKKTSTKSSNTIPYCTSLNKLAEKGEIDNLIGRNDEIKKIYKIFNRKRSNNVLLVGESGVGKTAIVEGLAKDIVNGAVPHCLYNKEIFRLNISEIMAGTQFRGMFEERMTNLIKNLRNNKNAILFIDDIHTAINDNKKNDFDMGGMLMDILTTGDVQIIATTTFKGYKSCFEHNSNLSSRFQRIDVEAPNDLYTYEILMGIKPSYEKYHDVTYTDEAIKECVRLSKEYIIDRSLPTSAIDIMDEAGSILKYESTENDEIFELRQIIVLMKEEVDEHVKADEMDLAEEVQKEIEKKRLKLAKMERAETEKKGKRVVDVPEIYRAISEHTNIPVSRVSTTEKEIIAHIDDTLKKSIIGQDEAIEKITRAIKRSKVGIRPSNRPLGSFLCIGNTGCGKTLMAKMLAKEIFGDEKYLVRLDMSEYADKTSVNKLVGSSAGYVGYERGGVLTEKIKNKKHAVLLIDEIEKANEEIYNLFLQILDEGCLSDNNGQKVDFRNTIIIMTSNVGAKEASQNKGIGLTANENANKRNIIEKELKNKFPPEFINRLDDIIYFNMLTDDNLRNIIRLELNHLNERIDYMKYSIKYSDKTIDKILESINDKKEYGARPIIKAIQSMVENKITDILLEQDVNERYIFDIDNLIE